MRKPSFFKKTQIFLAFVFCPIHYAPANSEPIFEGWSRASPLGAKNAAVYGRFYNPTKEKIELSEVVFGYSESASLHQIIREKGVAKMRSVDLSLGPKQEFYLEPGGVHIMLINLASPLGSGCAYPLDFKWRNGLITTAQFFVGEINQNSSLVPESITVCPK
ncbi:copper chaperone PCu(A)C [Gammaproteobacteria bacterium]|nr:copper chaperone PCu(A)C [Gammaproteobacteria bacterium]